MRITYTIIRTDGQERGEEMVDITRKQKLRAIGAEVLSDALMDLEICLGPVKTLVDRLVCSEEENIRYFKDKFLSIRGSDHYVDWREVSDFSMELAALLQSLKYGVRDPLIGMELVAQFYELDVFILNYCDDSCGDISQLFGYNAKELFLEYACHCEDKQKVADLILKLSLEDEYSLRCGLIESVRECNIPEELIRSMVVTLQKLGE